MVFTFINIGGTMLDAMKPQSDKVYPYFCGIIKQ